MHFTHSAILSGLNSKDECCLGNRFFLVFHAMGKEVLQSGSDLVKPKLDDTPTLL